MVRADELNQRWPRANHAEACLAHAVKDKVEAACARSDLLKRRRPLMQARVDYRSDDA